MSESSDWSDDSGNGSDESDSEGSDDRQHQFGGYWDGNGEQPDDWGALRTKWSVRQGRIVGATENIVFWDPDSATSVCHLMRQLESEVGITDDVEVIRIYSGLHGAPNGSIQVYEPTFAKRDRKAFVSDDDGLRIEVVDLSRQDMFALNTAVPGLLAQDLDDTTVYVVLAWCNSARYLDFLNWEPGAS